MSAQRWEAGVLRYWEDDGSRFVYVYGADGKETSRTPYTAAQNAAADTAAAEATAGVNEQTLRDRARAAMTGNATYLGRSSPTAAQNTAQIQALTRQVNALIKLEVRDLNATDGT